MRLRGVNLGGWLMMEGYILRGRNIPEKAFKHAFKQRNGSDSLREFETCFRDSFITENDFKLISSMGATVVRLPLNHRVIETSPGKANESGLRYVDQALTWAARNNLSVILDLHSAPGSQNADWHSDSSGKALMWERPMYRRRALSVLETLAGRYRNSPALAGYDILNEPVLEGRPIDLLTSFYRDAIRAIRSIDKQHTIFIEGSHWAQQIELLAPLIEPGVNVSIHMYEPFLYTFNLRPFHVFPGPVDGTQWSKAVLRRHLMKYYRFSRAHNTRIFVGEFGINWRGGAFGEAAWLDTVCSLFNEFDFDYTYWTWKAVANCVFPDGIYQYLPNDAFVRREGPVYGWENYHAQWPAEKETIAGSWDTTRYSLNKSIAAVLRGHFTGKN